MHNSQATDRTAQKKAAGSAFRALTGGKDLSKQERDTLFEVIIEAEQPWWAYNTLLEVTITGNYREKLLAIIAQNSDKNCKYWTLKEIPNLGKFKVRMETALAA